VHCHRQMTMHLPRFADRPRGRHLTSRSPAIGTAQHKRALPGPSHSDRGSRAGNGHTPSTTIKTPPWRAGVPMLYGTRRRSRPASERPGSGLVAKEGRRHRRSGAPTALPLVPGRHAMPGNVGDRRRGFAGAGAGFPQLAGTPVAAGELAGARRPARVHRRDLKARVTQATIHQRLRDQHGFGHAGLAVRGCRPLPHRSQAPGLPPPTPPQPA
jgi:hypothetical protein